MDKFIKEILTKKAVRNNMALIALVVTVMDAGMPWQG
jgi:hypothetical protein